jgi:hypothetical protein
MLKDARHNQLIEDASTWPHAVADCPQAMQRVGEFNESAVPEAPGSAG